MGLHVKLEGDKKHCDKIAHDEYHSGLDGVESFWKFETKIERERSNIMSM